MDDLKLLEGVRDTLKARGIVRYKWGGGPDDNEPVCLNNAACLVEFGEHACDFIYPGGDPGDMVGPLDRDRHERRDQLIARMCHLLGTDTATALSFNDSSTDAAIFERLDAAIKRAKE